MTGQALATNAHSLCNRSSSLCARIPGKSSAPGFRSSRFMYAFFSVQLIPSVGDNDTAASGEDGVASSRSSKGIGDCVDVIKSELS